MVRGCPATPIQSPITTGEEPRCHGWVVGGPRPHLPSCESRDKARFFLEAKCQRNSHGTGGVALGRGSVGGTMRAIYCDKMCPVTCCLSVTGLLDHTHHSPPKEPFLKSHCKMGWTQILSISAIPGRIKPWRELALLGLLGPVQAKHVPCSGQPS